MRLLFYQILLVIKRKWHYINAQYGSYPTSLDGNNCALLPDPDTNYCLKFSSGVSFGYSGTTSTFSMSANKSGVAFAVTDSSAPVATMTNWKQLSIGSGHSCGVSTDNKAYCWGTNGYGQLGNNSTVNTTSPVAVDTSGVLSGKTILSVVASYNHTCAVASDNLAYCWGIDTSGELGNNSLVNSSVPVAVYANGVLSGKTVKSVAPGFSASCVIASDNQAYCWGGNINGTVGNNSTAQISVPAAVYTTGALSGKTILSIYPGTGMTCAVASNNLAYCWGGAGRLGDGSSVQSPVPVAVSTAGALSGKTIKSMTLNWSYSCVIASDNQAYCWGWNNAGQPGNNSIVDSTIPVAVVNTGALSGKTVKSIAAGTDSHTCVIASDNQVYCWGSNDKGQYGNGTVTQSTVPVATTNTGALSGKTISTILSGGSYTYAIGSNNHVYAWGENSNGQFGNGTNVGNHLPILVF